MSVWCDSGEKLCNNSCSPFLSYQSVGGVCLLMANKKIHFELVSPSDIRIKLCALSTSFESLELCYRDDIFRSSFMELL